MGSELASIIGLDDTDTIVSEVFVFIDHLEQSVCCMALSAQKAGSYKA